MKKLLVLVALFTTVYVTQAHAQQGAGTDPAAMRERYKDRIKPMLIEKAKITEAQADKVIEISFNYRTKMRDLRNLGDADRKKQYEQLMADQVRDFKAIPLTEDQVKAVNQFFEEQRQQMMQRQQQNGGGNGGGNQ